MDIIELIRNFCVELQKEEAYIEFAAARKANDEDKKLQEDIAKFNLVRMQMDQVLSNTDTTREEMEEKVEKLNAELRETYSVIMSNESMAKYNAAKTKLDTLMNKINEVIALSLDGEDPLTCKLSEGCSGSCATCSGCH